MKVQTLIDMADNGGVLFPKIKEEKEEDFYIEGMEICSKNQVFKKEEEIEKKKEEEKIEEPQPISTPEIDPVGFKIPTNAQVFQIDENTWVVKKVG